MVLSEKVNVGWGVGLSLSTYWCLIWLTMFTAALQGRLLVLRRPLTTRVRVVLIVLDTKCLAVLVQRTVWDTLARQPTQQLNPLQTPWRARLQEVKCQGLLRTLPLNPLQTPWPERLLVVLVTLVLA